MKRRTFLAAGAATAATLAAPRISRGADARVLKFIPQADPTIIDPIWTTAYVTRNHGFPDLRHAVWHRQRLSSRSRRWSRATPPRTTARPGSSPCATG